MNNRIIHIISNIKVIGWVTILVFSGTLYYCVHSLISAYYVTQMAGSILKSPELDNPDIIEMSKLINQLTVFFVGLSLISILGILIGRGLVHIKKWASTGFHILSVAIGLLILIGIIYSLIQYHSTPTDKFGMSNTILRLETLSLATLGLLISWLVTKVNILLFKKEYRIEMT